MATVRVSACGPKMSDYEFPQALIIHAVAKGKPIADFEWMTAGELLEWLGLPVYTSVADILVVLDDKPVGGVACYYLDAKIVAMHPDLRVGADPDLREVLLHELAHALVHFELGLAATWNGGDCHDYEFKRRYDRLGALAYYNHSGRRVPKWYELCGE